MPRLISPQLSCRPEIGLIKGTTMSAIAKPPVAATLPGVVGGGLGFVVIGALQALYGPAFPFLMAEFTLTPGDAGLLLSAHFVGALIGVLVFDALMGRLSNRAFLAVSYALMIGGCLIIGTSATVTVLMIGAFVTGLGFGGIDFGLNYLFSIGFGRRSAAMVNLLNAFFGVGAVLGPAVIGWVGAEHYGGTFIAFGAATLLCLGSVAFYSDSTGRVGPGADVGHGDAAAMFRNRATLGVLVAFFVLYIFHVAVETGIGGWAPTHLETVGYGAAFAATTTSGFWLAMTVGRFVIAPLAVWVRASRIMLITSIGLTVSVCLAVVTDLAPLAYLLAGLFIAPIFPTGIAWLGEVIPASRKATAWVVALSMIGGVAFPPLIGVLIGAFGVWSAPLFMAVLALGCVLAAAYVISTVSSRSRKDALRYSQEGSRTI